MLQTFILVDETFYESLMFQANWMTSSKYPKLTIHPFHPVLRVSIDETSFPSVEEEFASRTQDTANFYSCSRIAIHDDFNYRPCQQKEANSNVET